MKIMNLREMMMPLDELMMPKILDEGLMSFIKLNKELKIYKTIV